MYSNSAFTLQKTYYKRYAEFWGNLQIHMHMVGHQVPFHKHYYTLATQITYYLSDTSFNIAIQKPLPILGGYNYMVFAIPPDVR